MSATKLVLVGFPASAAVGEVIGPFTVEARSSGDVLDDRYIGQFQVVVLSGSGTLGGVQVYGIESGVATVDDLTYDTAEAGVQLQATDLDEVLTPATGTLDITGGAATPPLGAIGCVAVQPGASPGRGFAFAG